MCVAGRKAVAVVNDHQQPVCAHFGGIRYGAGLCGIYGRTGNGGDIKAVVHGAVAHAEFGGYPAVHWPGEIQFAG
ncbi:hypothetical protein SDC9_203079 [bioreactor metagenome]|uniref:Uncharacterized protein n=1 Tax=bioreactor metagenome TaxID=1076179 RepID=A0A645IW88_9ZZZZ